MEVPWDEGVLHYQFYRRLPDQISEVGKPDSLNRLCKLAQTLDHHYWERATEHNCEFAGNKPAPVSTTASDSQPPDSEVDSDSDSDSSLEPWTFTMFAKSEEKPIIKSYADKLQDGKLSQKEHQYRYDNNLCFLCGTPGHTTAICPKNYPLRTMVHAVYITPTNNGAAGANISMED